MSIHIRNMNRGCKSRGRRFGRSLSFEGLEQRDLLATLAVNLSTDGAVPTNDGNLTLREAIAYVNGTEIPGPLDVQQRIQGTLGQNDAIVFASNLNGGMITITGGTLVVTDRVTITGPANRVTIQKHASSTAVQGLLFRNFNLSPGDAGGVTGVFNVGISGFDVGLKLENLTCGTFDVNRPFQIVGNSLTDVGTGIFFENADVPFHIESNVIRGRSSGTGSGILLRDSGQFTASGTFVPTVTIQPTIGRAEQNAGNTITFFQNGIQVVGSSFPALRISGNVIGGTAQTRYTPYGWRAARSRHAGGVNLLLADGSLQFVAEAVDLGTWQALATIDGSDAAGLQ